MGNNAIAPHLAQNRDSWSTHSITTASCSVRGYRDYQEDAHRMWSHPNKTNDVQIYFTAVYDGHSGPEVSNFASRYFHRFLAKAIQLTEGEKNIENKTIEDAFLEFDLKTSEYSSGSTANTVMFKFDYEQPGNTLEIICSNIGDSRALLYSNGKTIALSEEHEPTKPEELKRILAAGHTVEGQRINGGLNLSRAFGDFKYKDKKDIAHRDQAVCSVPEIKRVMVTGLSPLSKEERSAEIEDVNLPNITPEQATFVLQGSDGLWEHGIFKDDELIQFALQRMNAYKLFDNSYQVQLTDLYKYDPNSWINKPLSKWDDDNWTKWIGTQYSILGEGMKETASTAPINLLNSLQFSQLSKLAALGEQLQIQEDRMHQLPTSLADKLELVAADLTTFAMEKSKDNLTVVLTLIHGNEPLSVTELK